jgi:outer membrane protein OmpA-like peptidoglycan-associated protein
LQEVVKLLQGSPGLRVWVVGHTDKAGTAEFNVTLSNARAAAVVKALAAGGSRLRPARFVAGKNVSAGVRTQQPERLRHRIGMPEVLLARVVRLALHEVVLQ